MIFKILNLRQWLSYMKCWRRESGKHIWRPFPLSLLQHSNIIFHTRTNYNPSLYPTQVHSWRLTRRKLRMKLPPCGEPCSNLPRLSLTCKALNVLLTTFEARLISSKLIYLSWIVFVILVSGNAIGHRWEIFGSKEKLQNCWKSPFTHSLTQLFHSFIRFIHSFSDKRGSWNGRTTGQQYISFTHDRLWFDQVPRKVSNLPNNVGNECQCLYKKSSNNVPFCLGVWLGNKIFPYFERVRKECATFK